MKKIFCLFVCFSLVLPLFPQAGGIDVNAFMEECGQRIAYLIGMAVKGVEPGEVNGRNAAGSPYTIKALKASGGVQVIEYTEDMIALGTTYDEAKLHSNLLLIGAGAYLEDYGFTKIKSDVGLSYVFKGTGGSLTVFINHILNNAQSGDGKYRFRVFYRVSFQP